MNQQLSIKEVFSRMVHNPISFMGRMSRSEFFIGNALQDIIALTLTFISLAPAILLLEITNTSTIFSTILWGLMGLIGCFYLLIKISFLVRRLHDRNYSAWYLFLLLIPIVNTIIIILGIFIILGRSQNGPNRYGPQPEETLPVNPDVNPNDYDFGERFEDMIRHTFTITGRLSRHSFFMAYVPCTIISTILANIVSHIVSASFEADASAFIEPLTVFILLLCYLPLFSAIIRRLHDAGRSGWWLLLHFIPIAHLIILYFLASPSSESTRYGEILPENRLN